MAKPVPFSVRVYRPICIQEITYIENQVVHFRETEVSMANEAGKIKHTIVLTMIDGKVCHAATDTASTMRCYICGQT
ncbi:hypothetical protein PR048_021612 [Dryococelus australis]|uniref:Uncharacterized protein n=1 Tax=Dryococelus australis TaxID=614101 RepID=A0ABQ9GYP6_9NEOP|nr:hypothetical protein PR048_021612 [Dryococelus australis]